MTKREATLNRLAKDSFSEYIIIYGIPTYRAGQQYKPSEVDVKANCKDVVVAGIVGVVVYLGCTKFNFL